MTKKKGGAPIVESFDKLQTAVIAAAADVTKAKAGNQSAGERLRKAMQEVKELAQAVRTDALALYKK
jgi:hypothetical protein